MEVTLVDSPVSNRANILRALRAAGAEVRLTSDPREIESAGKLVLPGVGSFAAAMEWLEGSGVADAIRAAATRGTPLLGICVGHQVLFESSEEMGTTAGLGLIAGRVRRMESHDLPVPQIGWNRVTARRDPLFDGIPESTPFYFVNSYVAMDVPEEFVLGRGVYGEPFVAAVRAGSVWGLQMHPEKSSTHGLELLRNFVERCA